MGERRCLSCFSAGSCIASCPGMFSAKERRGVMAAFSEELFRRIDSVYRRILAHPFLQGLTDGTLSEAAFRFYAIQDALYLRDYARGLSLLGAKSPTDEASIMFNEHAKPALIVERPLHG